MRTLLPAVLALSVGCADPLAGAAEPTSAVAPARAEVGQPAPAFSLPDLDGTVVSLADHLGKWVVLEWFNPDCPYIRHAHGPEGPLRSMPGRWTAKGVVWLAVNSGAPGQEGHGVERNRAAVAEYGLAVPVLLDASGATGRAYGAKVTPTIYVIDPQGVLVYWGGLDNAPRGVVPAEGYRPYAEQALQDALGGQFLRASRTRPYG